MKLGTFIAGVFGAVGFALSLLSGVMSGNTMESILGRGVLCALGCYVIGYLVGLIAQQVAVEHAQQMTESVAAEDARQAAEDREEQARREAEAADKARTGEPVAASVAQVGPVKG